MEANWISKLRKRWDLDSARQVFVVLLVFACTGTTIVLIKRPVTEYFFGDNGPSSIFSILYWVFILPIYNILLLVYGFLFGKFRFFWNYEKKFFRRILRLAGL